MANANFLYGVFWLAFGAALIVAQSYRPDVRWLRIWGSDLSIGWAGVILGVYNFVRWWSVRSHLAERRQREEAYERRLRELERRPRVEQEPDPNFDFTKPPPGQDPDGPGPS